jgi:RNA polymerase sigma factor (TIGR02999 family)
MLCVPLMNDVTRLLADAAAGDPQAAAELLPRVYAELRKLAAVRLTAEKPGHTLQATALVHEAYIRLIGTDPDQPWNGRGHFFAAAAEAMRRILVDAARCKARVKRGGDRGRVDLDAVNASESARDDDLVALSEALDQLAVVSPSAAELVKLRYFAGFTGHQAAELIGVSPRKGDQLWAYARAWLLDKLADPE